MIAGFLDSGSGGDRFENASVVEGVVSFQDEPVIQVRFAGPVETASAGSIDIEIQLFVAAKADGIGRTLLLVNQIAKLVCKNGGGKTKTISAEVLIDSGVDGVAALR